MFTRIPVEIPCSPLLKMTINHSCDSSMYDFSSCAVQDALFSTVSHGNTTPNKPLPPIPASSTPHITTQDAIALLSLLEEFDADVRLQVAHVKTCLKEVHELVQTRRAERQTQLQPKAEARVCKSVVG